MFKMNLILENLTAQIYLTSYLLRGKWSTVAMPMSKYLIGNSVCRLNEHIIKIFTHEKAKAAC
jgi:hypothetical protein